MQSDSHFSIQKMSPTLYKIVTKILDSI